MKIRVEDAGQSVRTDDKWIRFILDQIIVNAVKYRSEHPVLNFSVSQEKRTGSFCTVEDNGIGIPEGDLPRILTRVLPAGTAGEFPDPPESVCTSADGCASSWESD